MTTGETVLMGVSGGLLVLPTESQGVSLGERQMRNIWFGHQPQCRLTADEPTLTHSRRLRLKKEPLRVSA